MRTLSSIFTFPTKYIFPVVSVLAIGVAVFHFMDYAKLSQMIEMQPMPIRILIPVVWLVGTIYAFWFAYQLKRVRFDGTALYVSNYRQECRIPLADIDQISERRWIKGHPVRVLLRQPCDFGTDFTFIPAPVTSFSFSWNEHPIMAELRGAILAAKSSSRLR